MNTSCSARPSFLSFTLSRNKMGPCSTQAAAEPGFLPQVRLTLRCATTLALLLAAGTTQGVLPAWHAS